MKVEISQTWFMLSEHIKVKLSGLMIFKRIMHIDNCNNKCGHHDTDLLIWNGSCEKNGQPLNHDKLNSQSVWISGSHKLQSVLIRIPQVNQQGKETT